MKKLNMRDVQFWTFLPNVVELVGGLQEKFLLYYCVDEWSKFSFMDGRSMREMEINLLKLADLVITSAEHLYRDKAQFNPNTHLIPHGVDYKYFSKCIHNSVPIADRMSSIRKPIIGFFGLIHEWIDLDLIEKLATENSEWSIVMIGRWSVNIDRFNANDNVHFLGQKPYEELLSYCKAFDVGLIPFHVNDLTVNVNPIKLREYLAAGIPVVSTALPEVEKYSDIVAIARDAKEFVEKTREILNNDNEDMRLQRSQKMRDESWEMKAEHILHLIDALER
jgi:glycosyltransferase involved in cell wall biosynthesis